MSTNHRSRNWIWLPTGVAGIVLLIWLGNRAPAPAVNWAEVKRDRLSATVGSNGRVEPTTPHALRAQFPAFVQKVLAVEGRAVRRGELLLVLDAAETRAALARAREELLRAEEDLRAARAGGRADELAAIEANLRKLDAEIARLRRERQALERLVKQQAATREELEVNRVALERTEADQRLEQQKKDELARRSKPDAERAALLAERARNEIRSLEEKVRSAELHAPQDGTLYSLPVKEGQYVRVGDLLAELADLASVRVRAYVDEPELAGVAEGQQVEITWDAAPGRVWRGQTDQIPRAVVARGTRSVGEVLCSVENEKRELLPNINVNVRIHLQERANALVVPRGAVRVAGNSRYVFVLDGSRLKRREVKLGIAGATMYEVVEGLAAGERVALPGNVELRDGMEVRVVAQQ